MRLLPEQREAAEIAIMEALRANPAISKTECAAAAGLDYYQLHSVLQNNEGFRKRFEAMRQLAEQARIEAVEDAHFDLATGKSKAGNVIAQIHILKNRDKRYAERHQAIGSITVNIDRAQIALAGQTIEEMRKIEGDQADFEVE